jgi:hypothetical protein
MQLTRYGVWGMAFFGLVSTARADTTSPEQAAPPPPPALVPPTETPPPSRSVGVRAGTDVAGYADSDHVFVLTPSIMGHVENPAAGWNVDGTYLVDIISAASVDIVSTASRPYTEIRQAGTLGASYQPRTFGGSVNGSVSREPDYLSWTAGGSINQDLHDKNQTLFLGFNHGHDVAGRTGTPFSIFEKTLDIEALKAGVTFVIDRKTIASVVADSIFENGDPSKPYRYVAMFEPGTSLPNGAPISLVNSVRVSERPLEQLPLSRQRYAGSFRIAHRFGGRATLRFDERLYADSWGLKATSSDTRYLLDVGPRFEVGPHVRFHAQTEVDFWQRAYTLGPGLSIPALRTGDRELGPLIGLTGGFSFRWKLGPAAHRAAWVLGCDVNVMETHYLDDIYITDRLSTVGGISLEAEL